MRDILMKMRSKVIGIILMVVVITIGCNDVERDNIKKDMQVYTKIYVGISSDVHESVLKQLNKIMEEDGYKIIIKSYDNTDDLLYAVAADDIDAAYGITNQEVAIFCQNTGMALASQETNTFEPLVLLINPDVGHTTELEVMLPENENSYVRAVELLSTDDASELREYGYRLIPFNKSEISTVLKCGGGVIMEACSIQEELLFSDNYIEATEKRNNNRYDIVLAVSETKKDQFNILPLKQGFQSKKLIKYIREQYLGAIEIIQ